MDEKTPDRAENVQQPSGPPEAQRPSSPPDCRENEEARRAWREQMHYIHLGTDKPR
jgi:hypothetical protein